MMEHHAKCKKKKKTYGAITTPALLSRMGSFQHDIKKKERKYHAHYPEKRHIKESIGISPVGRLVSSSFLTSSDVIRHFSFLTDALTCIDSFLYSLYLFFFAFPAYCLLLPVSIRITLYATSVVCFSLEPRTPGILLSWKFHQLAYTMKLVASGDRHV